MKQDFELEKAALLMVEALYIAATQDKETAVADYLEDQLTGGTLSLNGLRHHFNVLGKAATPPLTYHQHPLNDYDHLLNQPLSNPESASQESPVGPHVDAMGNP
jgi:hypothetical protein